MKFYLADDDTHTVLYIVTLCSGTVARGRSEVANLKLENRDVDLGDRSDHVGWFRSLSDAHRSIPGSSEQLRSGCAVSPWFSVTKSSEILPGG